MMFCCHSYRKLLLLKLRRQVQKLLEGTKLTVTEQESVLFREDCFAVKCINRVLFSELGKKYLNKLVTPITKSILAVKDPIDVPKQFLKLSNRLDFSRNDEK